MDLREVGCDPGEWIDLAEDRDQWRAFVRAIIVSIIVLKFVGNEYVTTFHNMK